MTEVATPAVEIGVPFEFGFTNQVVDYHLLVLT